MSDRLSQTGNKGVRAAAGDIEPVAPGWQRRPGWRGPSVPPRALETLFLSICTIKPHHQHFSATHPDVQPVHNHQQGADGNAGSTGPGTPHHMGSTDAWQPGETADHSLWVQRDGRGLPVGNALCRWAGGGRLTNPGVSAFSRSHGSAFVSSRGLRREMMRGLAFCLGQQQSESNAVSSAAPTSKRHWCLSEGLCLRLVPSV